MNKVEHERLAEIERGRGTGKWAMPGVPHRGWVCESVEDLEEPDATCEMCEVMRIRYVHHMSHPDYPVELTVGCVCAGHMEEDSAAPVERERVLRNTATRRARWLSLRWRRSRKGNPYLKTRDGFHVVVFRKPGGWGGRVEDLETEGELTARRTYPTEERAKLASFDAMIFLLNKR